MSALIGTPAGFSQSGSMVGHCDAGAVKRELGCAAFAPVAFAMAGVHFFPCQSRHSAGGVSVMPSHQTPASGLMARRRPAASGLSHAMSSPTVQIFQPCAEKCAGGMSMAKLVLPQALGNA